ncbi:MAG: Rieske (2Fe-2S) protein [Dongiaceae bacterium]
MNDPAPTGRSPVGGPPIRLCRLEALPEGAARGFVIGEGGARREVFLHRDADRVRGWRNACPHVGTPLDIAPDRFLTEDGAYFLCQSHGALFRLADGFCIAGPCQGKSLMPEAIRLEAGWVLLTG